MKNKSRIVFCVRPDGMPGRYHNLQHRAMDVFDALLWRSCGADRPRHATLSSLRQPVCQNHQILFFHVVRLNFVKRNRVFPARLHCRHESGCPCLEVRGHIVGHPLGQGNIHVVGCSPANIPGKGLAHHPPLDRDSQRKQLFVEILRSVVFVSASFPFLFSVPLCHNDYAILSLIQSFHDLPLIDANLLKPREKYTVRMRADIDIESLPTPVRLWAYLGSEWSLKSNWYQWSLKP